MPKQRLHTMISLTAVLARPYRTSLLSSSRVSLIQLDLSNASASRVAVQAWAGEGAAGWEGGSAGTDPVAAGAAAEAEGAAAVPIWAEKGGTKEEEEEEETEAEAEAEANGEERETEERG